MRRRKIEGGASPIERVHLARARARHLIRGLTGPPYDLDTDFVRKGAKIKQIAYRRLPIDGRIFWDTDGYVIEINASASKQRQRFTLAHEIAHALFLCESPDSRSEGIDSSDRSFVRDHEEEYLCDIAAAEMLMPTDIFEERVCRYGPSVETLMVLSQEFGTSLQATARRFAELATVTCHIGFWHFKETAGLEFQFGLAKSRMPLNVKRGVVLRPDHFLMSTVNSGKPTYGWADIGLISAFDRAVGKVFLDALHLPSAKLVVSVAILEDRPDILYTSYVAKRKGHWRRAASQLALSFAS